MANEHKGEVSFKADGKDYVLSFSANAWCELEGALGKDADEIQRMFSGGSTVRLSDLRIVFWQGLRDHHEGTTLEDAKAILKHIRPLEMGTLLGKAILASMPEIAASADDGGGSDKKPDPQTPGGQSDGTGPAST